MPSDSPDNSEPPTNRSWLPYLVLAIALASTMAAAIFVEHTTQAKDQIRFDNSVRQVQETISNRLSNNIDLLLGARGLFDVNNNMINATQFAKYVDSLKLREQHAGVQGMGLSILFPTTEVDHVTATMRKQGFDDFHIWPEGKSDLTSAIVYLVPNDELNKH